MKRIIFLSLLFTGFIYKAEAQKKHSGADQNFRICFVGGQYVACDADAPITSAGTMYETTETHEMPPAPPVHMGKGSARKSRMMVAYDDPNAPYQGEESAVNDGVEKNNERNINYMNNAANVPPNDGGLSNKK